MIGVFEVSLLFQRKALKKSYDESRIDRWLGESKKIYRELRVKLPDIGGRRNKMLSFLKSSLLIMPIVMVLKREGEPIRKIGEVMYDVVALAYQRIPPIIRRISASGYFRSKKVRKWEQIAERSQSREFSGDWVVTVAETAPSLHHGYDIAECAILKFWREQGLEEFVPYLCLTDWAKWSALGINAQRTKTLANGHEKCDFRFIRSGTATVRGWPPESVPEWTGAG